MAATTSAVGEAPIAGEHDGPSLGVDAPRSNPSEAPGDDQADDGAGPVALDDANDQQMAMEAANGGGEEAAKEAAPPSQQSSAGAAPSAPSLASPPPSSSPTSSPIKLGGPHGSHGTPAYALLAGLSFTGDVVAIPITRLPTTLGKEHDTRDASFVGLQESSSDGETSKAGDKLSKAMCVIFYRDARGGRLGHYRRKKGEDAGGAVVGADGADATLLEGMVYKPYEGKEDGGEEDKGHTNAMPPSPDDILRPSNGDAKAPLPPHGFFAIECTCRQISVGGRLLKKGQSAILENGTPIRIASYCLYFLLPTMAGEPMKPPPSFRVKAAEPMQVKAEKGAPVGKKEGKLKKKEGEKKKAEKKAGSGSGEKKKKKAAEDSTSSATSPPPPKKKAKKATAKEAKPSPLDDKSDAELLQLLRQKVTEETWDQEGQKIGTALALRIVASASRAPSILSLAQREGGVTQREIMEWMNDPSNVYREYETMMLRKIEKKSFLGSVGKAIARAGYVKREATSGRAIRWQLPPAGEGAAVAAAASKAAAPKASKPSGATGTPSSAGAGASTAGAVGWPGVPSGEVAPAPPLTVEGKAAADGGPAPPLASGNAETKDALHDTATDPAMEKPGGSEEGAGAS